MDENNSTNLGSNGSASGGDQKPVKDSKKGGMDNKKHGQGFVAAHKAEFRKISWPSREDLFKQTVTVIIISLIVGAVIFCLDSVFNFGFSALLDLMK